VIARVVALLAVAAVAVAGAPAGDAVAAKKSKRVPACKTKKASKRAAKQPKRKRRCRPQARHLRKAPAKTPAPVRPAAPPTAVVLPPTPGGAATEQPAAPVDPTCGPSRNLGATAEDAGGFRLRLTRTCVPSGQVTVNWQNTDSSEHDLWAAPLGATTGTVQQIVTAALTTEMPVFGDVTLTPGRWELFCSLSGHGAMRASVTVTP
jgi:hypothetical protein